MFHFRRQIRISGKNLGREYKKELFLKIFFPKNIRLFIAFYKKIEKYQTLPIALHALFLNYSN